MVLNLMIGLLTPPVGMVLFVLSRVAKMSFDQTVKAVTPFLLARLAEVTAGRSLASNIALVKNNARVAARIAAAYCARI